MPLKIKIGAKRPKIKTNRARKTKLKGPMKKRNRPGKTKYA